MGAPNEKHCHADNRGRVGGGESPVAEIGAAGARADAGAAGVVAVARRGSQAAPLEDDFATCMHEDL